MYFDHAFRAPSETIPLEEDVDRLLLQTRRKPNHHQTGDAGWPRIEWSEFSESVLSFITMLATRLTFSIATGLSLGLISYTVVKIAAGKFRENYWADMDSHRTLHSALHLSRRRLAGLATRTTIEHGLPHPSQSPVYPRVVTADEIEPVAYKSLGTRSGGVVRQHLTHDLRAPLLTLTGASAILWLQPRGESPVGPCNVDWCCRSPGVAQRALATTSLALGLSLFLSPL